MTRPKTPGPVRVTPGAPGPGPHPQDPIDAVIARVAALEAALDDAHAQLRQLGPAIADALTAGRTGQADETPRRSGLRLVHPDRSRTAS